MPARLVPLVPNPRVLPILLQRPVVLVGRHAECDIRIDLPQVSRRHCCLALAYDRLLIRDLGSRNGVRVNGRLIDEARLQPGDEIAIAHLVYRLEDSEAARPKPPARATPQAPARQADLVESPMNVDSEDIQLIPFDDD